MSPRPVLVDRGFSTHMSNASPDRRLPLRHLTVGAVGHRLLPSEQSILRGTVTEILNDLFEQQAFDPGKIRLLVSVAEGADRLFIEAAASLGIPYTCVLPCSAHCFEEDFESVASIEQFRDQLAGAMDIIQPDTEHLDRIGGYRWASDYIVEHADVLLAVWNGEPANGPAGTGDSVADAEMRSVPVIWIPSEAPHEPIELTPIASVFD